MSNAWGGLWDMKKVITTRRNQNELGVWKEVDHPNLVPLWATIDKGGLKSMVTPFYKHGDLMKYLKHIEEQGRCSAVPNNNLALRYHLVSAIFSGIVMWNELIVVP